MELQDYLRKQGLESLCNQFKIKVNRHQQFPDLVCLKYSQIESPLEEKIVQQCRGIILDEANNWEIISYPYDKFFNYGESQAATLDWKNTRVYEKLDGSLMVLYFYQGEWKVQSSGTPDGIAEVKGFDLTFAELFWKVWHSAGYQLPQETAYCFMFELMTPYNRIVVRHNREQLILHGARNIQTLQEDLPSKWEGKYGWKIVKTYPLTTLPLIIEATEALDPMISEGYIVCDHRFNRLKVKSAKYIEISSVKSGFSTRSILEIILTNEGEEFLTYYPKWLESFNQIKANYDALVREIETTYEQYKDIPVQKDFALAVKHLPYCGTLFALRAQKVSSVREFLCHLPIGKLETLLDLDYVHLG